MLRLRVKEVAKEKGIGQMKLARMADMASNTLRAIYRDPYREVATTTINKLAKALGVPVTELIEDVPEEMYEQEKNQQGDIQE
ncbi:XRE family transcriptional regulator [Ktedonosporobacter rubrisoli]|uniref:XRE family transcriptional regulator n=1 Tax=Ktedonosporobacter rubrisoli TaxID=2509675 RepID=A0A4P6JM34_KTERU|nr:helix-turn-helix transcriptional regulator [Ktedonosporobacter rubrisoli]QBD76298.1 XRE family transcriptional regulator [Ktedonosporobacter rubrisoli]